MSDGFQDVLRQLTQPINGQYPRPWMTDLADPLDATVFIVGLNPATAYPENEVDHRRFMNALFNRKGQTCRGLYEEITQGKPSRTRPIIEQLTECLAAEAIGDVLETNVVCYSTPSRHDLDLPEHSEGKEQGKKVFRTLVETIEPPILITHGQGPRELLGYALGAELPKPPRSSQEHPAVIQVPYCRDPSYRPFVFVIRSLSPQDFYTRWSMWTPDPLEKVALEVKRRLPQ